MSEPKLPPLPEPFSTLHDDGHWTMPRGKEPYQSRYAGWRAEVYSADQVRSIQLATLEFAASLCDAQEGDATVRAVSKGCAAAIRNAGEPQP